MTKKLFVGNLAYAMTDDQLTQIFAAHGQVVSVNIIKDRFSQRSKGFGFVEFTTEEEAAAAMQALDGSDQEGRNMVVKEATPRADDNKGGGPVTEAPIATEIPAAPVEDAPAAPVEKAPVDEVVAPVTEEKPTEEAPVEPTVETETEVAPVATDEKTDKEAPVLEEVPTEETEEK